MGTWSKEDKLKRSELTKLKWNDPIYREMLLKSRDGKYKAWNKGKKDLNTYICKTCNKSFMAAKSRIRIYCSRNCFRNDCNKDKNKNWKGGVTKFNKLERVKFQQTIQKKVFERDNYTCQICKKRGGKLQVDHIQPWAEYIEGRFDLNNCRTLCMGCHYFITFNKPIPKNLTWGHNLMKA